MGLLSRRTMRRAAIESKQRSAPRGGDWRRGIRSRVRGPTRHNPWHSFPENFCR